MNEDKGLGRFHHIGRLFDKTVQSLVPQYDFLQWETIRLFSYTPNDDFLLIDLGCGSGIFAEKVLNKYLKAEVCLVDFSLDFLDVARERLTVFEDRTTYVHADIRGEWQAQIGRKAEVITSMSTIHHFLPEEKKLVYQQAFDQLFRGGWFFNIDEMKALNEQTYQDSLAFWRDHVESFYAGLTEENPDFEYFAGWRPYFEEWAARTFTADPPPLEESVDKHESFADQATWLSEIGFANVDLFIKYHLWCVIGGQKPD